MAAKKSSTSPTAPESPAAAPVKPAAKKTAAKKTAAKKAAPAKKAAKKAAATKPAAPAKPAPSRDEIAHAAYLNYRGRKEKGHLGDSHGDWLEAERKLKER